MKGAVMERYHKKEERLSLAERLAEEAIVLLQNENHCLPLAEGCKAALFGRAQNHTVIGGGGSGSSQCECPQQAAQELAKAGLVLESSLIEFYRQIQEQEAEAQASASSEFSREKLEGLVNSGLIYELFGQYNPPEEEPLPDADLIKKAAEETDTAIYILGRMSGGEECDRHVLDDYYLTKSEKELIRRITDSFSRVIVVFNTAGAVDTAWMKEYPQIQAALFMGSAGERGAGALAGILTGRVTPCGKLSQTLALSYESYPTAEHMSYLKDDPQQLKTYESYGLSAEENGSTGYNQSPVTVYQEGLYMGYRYFDSFGKEVMFPFGHGLSYTEFQVRCESASVSEGCLRVAAEVKNTGACAGKETVQLYIHAPEGRMDKPWQELKAFEKTKCLAPGETQTLCLSVRLEELASFSEEEMAYVVEKGIYQVLTGTSSRRTSCVAELHADQDIIVRRVSADIGLRENNRGRVEFLKADASRYPEAAGEHTVTLRLTAQDICPKYPVCREYDFSAAPVKSTLRDVYEGRVSMEAFINQMSVEELAVLCNGYGPGLPFGGIGQKAPSTIAYEDGTDIAYNSHASAFPGYINPAISKYGIYSACYKDGPASVGLTAWPTGMMLGCTFNKELLYEFGAACAREAQELDVDSWLAPGMNLIRNPIGGRNFEYFSEDPIHAGICGVQIARGAMENNDITVCPKHFAMNEQETYRRGSSRKNIDAVDSIAEARVVRELYLKPFEMVLTQAEPRTLMTSFNKINGTFAAGNRTLCTEILRGEWGYSGVVVTDWGDMDAVVNGADAVAAGNDVVMPGGPPVIRQVLEGYHEGRVSLIQLKTAAAHLMNYVMHSRSFRVQAGIEGEG